ncbi:MAG TPA: thiamine pyrophosphate-dependent enzyme, partial [Croceibacterium sp.]|nr:thiamine pyrophosphate-dependent enzyme [Croceibacterium sp.]
EVRAAGARAIEHARSGNGPIILEMMTYRYRGHSMSDPAKYRTREEVQNVREHSDPIEGAKAELIKMGVDEDKLKDIDKRIKAQVAEAADFAESSPLPPEHELYTDVLVGSY